MACSTHDWLMTMFGIKVKISKILKKLTRQAILDYKFFC